MEHLRSTREKNNFPTILLLIFSFLILFISAAPVFSAEEPPHLWEIQSIDTMKESRDKAREQLNNPAYDRSIDKELAAIKDIGANYVAIGTPYDEEFMPYLKRWISLARKHDLHIWFRGNFSSWEGWFDYEKNMSPQEHLRRTAEFIQTHPFLFRDGDAFDPCPECENAGYWKQPEEDGSYNAFIRQQHTVVDQSFRKINKKVYSNFFSIIGGRAREVLNQSTADELGDMITIDHYIKNPADIVSYINYFSHDLHSKLLVSEWGAPIPDINGNLTENEQAQYLDTFLSQLYLHKNMIKGTNYYVFSHGTTALINDDGSLRQAAQVLKKYYLPAEITGKVTNSVGDRLKGVAVSITNMASTTTDKKGNYSIVIPSAGYNIMFSEEGYRPITVNKLVSQKVEQNITFEPLKMDFIYRIRYKLKHLLPF